MSAERATVSGRPISPVLIVGAGPIGLGASLELARCGIPSVLIEKNERTSWHPKTRNFNTRTMEIARGWGREIYDELRHLDLPPEWKSPIRFSTSIVGAETGHIVSKGFAGAGPDLSPVGSVLSSQDVIEPVMLGAIRKTGLVDVRFDTELIEITRGQELEASEVEVRVRNNRTGEVYGLSGPALIASDGATSFVRGFLGTEMDGPKKIAHFINCYFKADIEKYAAARPGILLFVANDRANGVFQPLDAKGRWLTQISVPEDKWSTDVFTNERCVEWIRAGVGVPDLDVNVLSVGKWQMNAVVGRQLVTGRILLMGDAAHMFPPTGGLGVNTGIQGMHNAIWKLALFLRGIAGLQLVQTYETERRPVARWVADQSFHNSKQVATLGAISRGEAAGDALSREEAIAATRRYGNHLGMELGTVYTSTAIVDDGTLPPEVADTYSDYVPVGRPGHRAPHVWVGLRGEKLSTIDLIGPEFSVLTGPQGEAWRRITTETSAEFGLKTPCYVVGSTELVDVENKFLERYGVSEDGAVLVRPDGFVAFRCRTLNSGVAAELRRAFGQVLRLPLAVQGAA